MLNYSQKDINRFWKKVLKTSNDECWKWTASTDKNGYGKFSIKGKEIRSHRFSYILSNPNNILNSEKFICHKCDNPGCVNPEHLFIGDHNLNVYDKVTKNRQAKGSDFIDSKLIEQDIIDMINGINSEKFKSIQEISDYYDIHDNHVCAILKGKNWKHVTSNLEISLEEIRSKIMNYHTNSKLSRNEVLEIRHRAANGESASSLSRDMSVSVQTVCNVINGRFYKHIT